MERLKILNEIQNVFRSVFDDEALIISEDSMLSEIEKRYSLEHANIVASIERTFGVRLSIEEVLSCKYVSDMVGVIEKHIPRDDVDRLTLEHANFEEKNPASSVQERLYALYCLNPERLDYNITLSVRMEGKLNVERLQNALERCLKCNPMLTAKFYQINGILSYKIRSEIQLKIERTEYESNNYDSFEDLRKNELSSFIKPFQLSADDLLIRARLVNDEDEKYLLLLDIHHIIFDGVSVSVFLEDLQRFYNYPECNSEKKYNYRDFVEWQEKFVESGEYERKQAYWKEVLSTETSICDLLVDYPHRRVELLASESYKIELFNYQEIDDLCRRYGITKFTFFIGIFSFVLSKLTFQSDITLGTLVSGRYRFREELNSTVGMFSNLIPIRNDILDDISFFDFITSVGKNNKLALQNSDVTYETILDISGNKKNNSPLFDVCLNYEESYNDMLKLENVSSFVEEIMTLDCIYDLVLVVNARKESFEITINYAKDLYKKSTIKCMSDLFVQTVDNVLMNGNIALKDIPTSSTEDKNKILGDFNDTAVDYPRDKTVVQLFEEQVERIPENIAVVFEEEQLTYKELNMRANALAHKLRGIGVGPDDYVGIMAEKSIETIVGLYGVIKAGGAYVPIDPAYPSERIQYILEDCSPKVILTHQAEVETPIPVINLSEVEVWEAVCENPVHVNQAEDLIYCIYTSGTTGKPKGVMIEHRNVISLVRNTNYVDFTDVIIGQAGSLSFDASTFEIWGALLNGGKVVLLPGEILLNATLLKEKLIRSEINTMFITTALYNQLISLDASTFDPLKQLLFGGEATSEDHVRKLVNRNTELSFSNIYGPTENTTYSLYYPITTMTLKEKTPIGKPISNTQVYILNDGNLCGIGVAGELCLSGAGVARGYLNQPELTAEKFVNNPYGEGKLYRSGDLARWLPDGNIEYLGRIDEQVKIRGFRIELGEIKSAIRELEEIKDCAVIVREDSSGEKAIYGYVVSDTELSISKTRDKLVKTLPEYMIPAYMTQVESMPMTRNGKLDKGALPEIEVKTEQEYVAPRTEVEEALCLVFKEILGVDSSIGIDDNFFVLGGDSIKAIRIVSKLRERGYQTDVRSIMQNKTPKAIGESLEEIEEMLIDQGEVVGEVALTPIQKDFILNDDEQMHHFNQSMALESEIRIDEGILRQVLNELVKHHDMLRATYEGQRQEVQSFKEDEGFDLYVHDYRDISDENQLAQEIDRASNEIQRSINLETGPLFKVGLFQAQTKDYLLLCLHHLVVDGVSWRILIEDFTTSYQLIENDKQVFLPQKTSSFQTWSEALGRYRESDRLKKELPYWKEVEENVESGNIVSNGTESTREIKLLSIELSEEQTSQFLYEAPQAYHAKLNDILLASVARGIARSTGNTTVSINMEGHGREAIGEDVVIDRTVGWFTSVYPVVIKSLNESIEDDICHVKETLRRIPSHGIGYGVLKSLGGKVLKGITPTVTFNYLGEFDSNGQDERFITSQYFGDNDVSEENTFQTSISIDSVISKRRFNMMISYDASKYSSEFMCHLQQEINKQLNDVIAHCLGVTSPQHTASDFKEMGWSHKEFKDVMDHFTKQGYEIEHILPLTGMQEGMLYHKLLSPESSEYVIQMNYSIKNSVSEEILRQSFDILMKKHQVLRTSIVYQDVSAPRQVVLKEKPLEFTVLDLSNVNQSEEALQAFYEQDILRGFDLESDSLMRLCLIKLSEEDYQLVISNHHIILDGWCISIIINDFLSFYDRLSEGQSKVEILSQLPKHKEYSDYIYYISNKEDESSRNYWENLLQGYEEKGSIPALRRGNQQVKESVDTLGIDFTEEETNRLEEMAQNYHVTLNTVVEAAWGILLQRYNRRRDVVFGKVVSGRDVDLVGIEEMVGLFINTIPIRVTTNNEQTFGELIIGLQEQALRSGEHNHYSLAEIQKLSGSESQLVQMTLAFENYYIQEPSNEHLLGLELKSFREETNYDLSLIAFLTNQLVLEITYHLNKYERDEIQNILDKLKALLLEITSKPEKKVKRIQMMTEKEKMLIMPKFKNTA